MRKLLEKISLSSETFDPNYEECPIQPGIHIYKRFGRGTPLSLRIADTLLINKTKIKRIYTDEKGTIAVDTISVDNESLRDQFIQRCLDSFVVHSTPLMQPPEPGYNRFVSVQKRPTIGKTPKECLNYTTLQQPLYFQTQLLEAFDSNIDNCIIQKFIKCRGKSACMYRIFWNNDDSGIVKGYNISRPNTVQFNSYDMVVDRNDTGDVNPSNSTPSGQPSTQTTGIPTVLPDATNTTTPSNITHDAPHDPDAGKQQATDMIVNLIKQAINAERVESDQSTPYIPPPSYSHSHSFKSRQSLDVFPVNTSPKSTKSHRHSLFSVKSEIISERSLAKFYGQGEQPSQVSNELKTNIPFASFRVESKDILPELPLLEDSIHLSGESSSTVLLHPIPRKRSSILQLPSNSSLPIEMFKRHSVVRNNKFNLRRNTIEEQLNAHEDMKDFKRLLNTDQEEMDRLYMKGLKMKWNLNTLERKLGIHLGAQSNRECLKNNICSIGDIKRHLNSDVKKDVLISQVSHNALMEPANSIGNIAHWMQHLIYGMHNILLDFEEIVCDFIKDENGNWWFINMKGFRLTNQSALRLSTWHKIHVLGIPEKALALNSPLVLSTQERILKQKSELGSMCKLCGLYYIENKVIDIMRQDLGDYEKLWGKPVSEMSDDELSNAKLFESTYRKYVEKFEKGLKHIYHHHGTVDKSTNNSSPSTKGNGTNGIVNEMNYSVELKPTTLTNGGNMKRISTINTQLLGEKDRSELLFTHKLLKNVNSVIQGTEKTRDMIALAKGSLNPSFIMSSHHLVNHFIHILIESGNKSASALILRPTSSRRKRILNSLLEENELRGISSIDGEQVSHSFKLVLPKNASKPLKFLSKPHPVLNQSVTESPNVMMSTSPTIHQDTANEISTMLSYPVIVPLYGFKLLVKSCRKLMTLYYTHGFPISNYAKKFVDIPPDLPDGPIPHPTVTTSPPNPSLSNKQIMEVSEYSKVFKKETGLKIPSSLEFSASIDTLQKSSSTPINLKKNLLADKPTISSFTKSRPIKKLSIKDILYDRFIEVNEARSQLKLNTSSNLSPTMDPSPTSQMNSLKTTPLIAPRSRQHRPVVTQDTITSGKQAVVAVQDSLKHIESLLSTADQLKNASNPSETVSSSKEKDSHDKKEAPLLEETTFRDESEAITCCYFCNALRDEQLRLESLQNELFQLLIGSNPPQTIQEINQMTQNKKGSTLQSTDFQPNRTVTPIKHRPASAPQGGISLKGTVHPTFDIPWMLANALAKKDDPKPSLPPGHQPHHSPYYMEIRHLKDLSKYDSRKVLSTMREKLFNFVHYWYLLPLDVIPKEFLIKVEDPLVFIEEKATAANDTSLLSNGSAVNQNKSINSVTQRCRFESVDTMATDDSNDFIGFSPAKTNTTVKLNASTSTKATEMNKIVKGACQWRIFIMFHYLVEEDSHVISEEKRLDKASSHSTHTGSPTTSPTPFVIQVPQQVLCSISYKFGQKVNIIPFASHEHIKSWPLTKDEEGLTTHSRNKKMVYWIKQCRMHYFCANNIEDIDHYFVENSIKFTVHSGTILSDPIEAENKYQTLVDAANEKYQKMKNLSQVASPSPTARQLRKQLKAKKTIDEVPPPSFPTFDQQSIHTVRIESDFQVHLSKIRWNSMACLEGSEKVDYLLPVHIPSLGGSFTLKLSVAVIKDDPLPYEVLRKQEQFTHKFNLYFPPSDYYDSNVIPDIWLSMLSEPPMTDELLRKKTSNYDEEKDKKLMSLDGEERRSGSNKRLERDFLLLNQRSQEMRSTIVFSDVQDSLYSTTTLNNGDNSNSSGAHGDSMVKTDPNNLASTYPNGSSRMSARQGSTSIRPQTSSQGRRSSIAVTSPSRSDRSSLISATNELKREDAIIHKQSVFSSTSLEGPSEFSTNEFKDNFKQDTLVVPTNLSSSPSRQTLITPNVIRKPTIFNAKNPLKSSPGKPTSRSTVIMINKPIDNPEETAAENDLDMQTVRNFSHKFMEQSDTYRQFHIQTKRRTMVAQLYDRIDLGHQHHRLQLHHHQHQFDSERVPHLAMIPSVESEDVTPSDRSGVGISLLELIDMNRNATTATDKESNNQKTIVGSSEKNHFDSIFLDANDLKKFKMKEAFKLLLNIFEGYLEDEIVNYNITINFNREKSDVLGRSIHPKMMMVGGRDGEDDQHAAIEEGEEEDDDDSADDEEMSEFEDDDFGIDGMSPSEILYKQSIKSHQSINAVYQQKDSRHTIAPSKINEKHQNRLLNQRIESQKELLGHGITIDTKYAAKLLINKLEQIRTMTMINEKYSPEKIRQLYPSVSNEDMFLLNAINTTVSQPKTEVTSDRKLSSFFMKGQGEVQVSSDLESNPLEMTSNNPMMTLKPFSMSENSMDDGQQETSENDGQQDIDESTGLDIRKELLESVYLALRKMEFLEFIPPQINWTILKPILMELVEPLILF